MEQKVLKRGYLLGPFVLQSSLIPKQGINQDLESIVPKMNTNTTENGVPIMYIHKC